MSEIHNEKVSVLSIYDREKGSYMPKKVRWGGRTLSISYVGYHHAFREGRKLVHIFSVVTDQNLSLRLRHDTETLHWILEETIDEFAS